MAESTGPIVNPGDAFVTGFQNTLASLQEQRLKQMLAEASLKQQGVETQLATRRENRLDKQEADAQADREAGLLEKKRTEFVKNYQATHVRGSIPTASDIQEATQLGLGSMFPTTTSGARIPSMKLVMPGSIEAEAAIPQTATEKGPDERSYPGSEKEQEQGIHQKAISAALDPVINSLPADSPDRKRLEAVKALAGSGISLPAGTFPEPKQATERDVPNFDAIGPDGKPFTGLVSMKGGRIYVDDQLTPEGTKLRRNVTASGSPDHFVYQPEIDPKTGTPTGRILGLDTRTNTGSFTKLPSDFKGDKAPPGAGQLAEATRIGGEAIKTLDLLDKSVDAAASMIGPGAGQLSSFQQMLGNADPAVQTLATNLLATKVQVDHALTGSARSANIGLINQWNDLLNKKVTPEGLKAVIEASRKLLTPASTGSKFKVEVVP